QAAYDSAFGRSSPAVYGGDVVGSTLYGFAYPYAIAFPEPLAAASAAAGNAAQQGFEYLSGDRSLFIVNDVRIAAALGSGTQLAVGNLPVPMISGSSLSKQIATKLQKGTISNVSDATLTKIAASNAPGSVVQNFTTNFVQNQVGRYIPAQGFSPSFSAAI